MLASTHNTFGIGALKRGIGGWSAARTVADGLRPGAGGHEEEGQQEVERAAQKGRRAAQRAGRGERPRRQRARGGCIINVIINVAGGRGVARGARRMKATNDHGCGEKEGGGEGAGAGEAFQCHVRTPATSSW